MTASASNARPAIFKMTIFRACIFLLVIASGLALRRFGMGLGLPFGVVKYGGSVLWATMVFFLVAVMAVRWPRPRLVLISTAIALAVELFRLIHTPALDAFRLTTVGALLLGRVFSPWNLVAYGFGIIAGIFLDRFGATVFAQAWTEKR